jgi:glycosyltransferase involved in cell wall biosynthesis
MGSVRKTRLIVPCYNEALRLNRKAFLIALESSPDLYFLFVDDGSTDETSVILRSMQEMNPVQITILSLENNSGKAEAVRRGILMSLDGLFDNVGYWDADLATPLAEIEGFCRLLDSTDAEMVVGSRVRLLGRRIERKAFKHYLGRVFATCASMLLDISVYDTQCGAKIFKKSKALRQVFAMPFKVNWTFDVEMMARFAIVRKVTPEEISSRWVEIPLAEWIDVIGSKVKLKDYIKGVFEFCTLLYYLHTPARTGYARYLGGTDPA